LVFNFGVRCLQMLERAEARAAGGKDYAEDAAAQVEHAVFMQSFIPRTLASVRDVEADVDRIRQGDVAGLYYASLTGMDGIGNEIAAKVRATATCIQETANPASVISGAVATVSAVPTVLPSALSASIESALPVSTIVSSERLVVSPQGGTDEDVAKRGVEDGEDSSSSSEDGASFEGDAAASGPTAFTKRHASKDERKLHKAAIKEQNREKRKQKMPKKEKKRKVAAGAHK
jgi:RIO kinase 1